MQENFASCRVDKIKANELLTPFVTSVFIPNCDCAGQVELWLGSK